MKKLLFILLFLPLWSMSQIWNWAFAPISPANANSYNGAQAVAYDTSKNYYIAGQFQSQIKFGSVVANPILKNIFVAKFDAANNCQWIKVAGAFNVSGAASITVDNNQDIIVTGLYYGTASFDTCTLTSNGASDVFLAKLDKNGNWKWVKNIGSASYDGSTKVAYDAANNIYLTGYLAGNTVIDGVPFTGTGGYDFFISKHDSSGHCMWIKQSYGTQNEKGTAMTISKNGTIYVGGVYTKNPTIFGTVLDSINQLDEFFFLSKLNNQGNPLWTKQLSCNAVNNEFGLSDMSADANDNIYLTGNFYYTCAFDTFNFTVASNAVRNIYATKIDSAGHIAWVKRGVGPANNVGNTILVDANNKVHIGGYFNDTLSFGSCTAYHKGLTGFAAIFDGGNGTCLCVDTIKKAMPGGMASVDSSITYVGYFQDTTYMGTSLISYDATQIFVSNRKDYCLSSTTNITSGLKNKNERPSIFPNPANDFVNLSGLTEKECKVEIYNSLGRLCHSAKYKNGDKINILSLATGSYIVKIVEKENNYVQPLIKLEN